MRTLPSWDPLRRACALLALIGAAGCTGRPSRPALHAVQVMLTGLRGGGLVLTNASGGATEELAVASDGTHAFRTELPPGATYAVAVKAQPTGPGQTCTVTGGSGTVASTDVTVPVTCAPTPALAVTVAGVQGTGLVLQGVIGSAAAERLAVPASGTFTFATHGTPGAAYAITVQAAPSSPVQVCSVMDGVGTFGEADVSVKVACSSSGYAIGGTILGLTGFGLALADALGEVLPVAPGDTSFTFEAKAASSATYRVEVVSQPQGQVCAMANGAGTIGASDVTNVQVTCWLAVVQRWDAPSTWGPVWADDPKNPTMVQHAWFGATAGDIQEQQGLAWSVVNGPLPPSRRLDALPAGTRYGSGPFDGPTAPRWEATGGDDALDLAGDMLACAIVKPGYDPTMKEDGLETGIVAKGVGFGIPPDDCTTTPSRCGAGWVLMQMHSQFCFHYQAKDATGTYANMIFTPTYFADRGSPRTGPLNPSYVAVCGGRAGDRIVVAANDSRSGVEFQGGYLRGSALDPVGVTGAVHHATIGGYDGAAGHQFGGRVYETAVWKQPATLENIQAKFAAFHGLAAFNASAPTQPVPVRYLRNREGPYLGPDGNGLAYHTAWRHGPRLDASKGLLFGLQGWNRLSHCINSWDGAAASCEDPGAWDRYVVAPGEALELWSASGGATVDTATTVVPPGDSEKSTAALVTLPPGASLSAPLLAFDGPGPVHGQIWLRVPATTTGTLRVTTTPAAAPADHAEIDLAPLQPGTWKRFWLKGLTTTGAAGTMSIEALPSNAGAVSFFAWGADVTQLSGGGDLGGFDPGPGMYDWSTTIGLFGAMFRATPEPPEDRPVNAVDVLELPPVPAGDTTAATGFCLSVDAQPADGLPWPAPFVRNRGLIAWIGATQAAQLYATGASDAAGPGQLCFSAVAATGASASACGAAPASWSPGSKHNVKGCLSASGRLRVYADDVRIGTAVALASTPDLTTGRVVVGNVAPGESDAWSWTGAPAPWNGYVSRALACRDPGPGNGTVSCR